MTAAYFDGPARVARTTVAGYGRFASRFGCTTRWFSGRLWTQSLETADLGGRETVPD